MAFRLMRVIWPSLSSVMIAFVMESRMLESRADSPIDRLTRCALWIITAAWPQSTETGSRFIRTTSSAISVTSQTSAPTGPWATRSGKAVIQPLPWGTVMGRAPSRT